MAASMVSTRIFLSIPFSFATCSKMKPRLVSVPDAAACIAMTVCLSVSFLFARLRVAPFGLGRKLEDEVCSLDVGERGDDCFAVHVHRDRRAVSFDDAAAKDALPVGGGLQQTKLGDLPDGPLVVPRGPEGSFEPGRAYLEVVTVGDDIGYVERGGQIA